MNIESYKNELFRNSSDLLSLRTFEGETSLWLSELYLPPDKIKNVFIFEQKYEQNSHTSVYYKISINNDGEYFELIVRYSKIAKWAFKKIIDNENISITILKQELPEVFV